MELNEEHTEIELMQLLRVLFRKAWIIILTAVLLGGIFCAYTAFFIQPMYTAETMLYVNNKSVSAGNDQVSISQGDLYAAQSLVETYGVILKSRNTLDEVTRLSGVDYSYEELKKMIRSEAINSTEVFRVQVESPDPKEAELLASTISEVLPEKIAAIVDGSSVRIIDYAVEPSQKSSPSLAMNTLLGAFLGMFLSCAVLVIRELKDDQIRDTDYILQHYDTPILAVIPDLGRKTDGTGYGGTYAVHGRRAGKHHAAGGAAPDAAGILGENLSFAATETYKLLRTNLEFSTTNEKKSQIIGVTSDLRGEGKTTTAINTAYTFAQTGKKVLLLEADMRLPNIAKRLKLSPTPGLSNLLSRRQDQGDPIQKASLIDHMWVIVAGNRPPNPAELLGSASMEKLFGTLSERFDVIIVDLPPVGVVSDALTISKFLDGIVVVARERMCTRRGLGDTLRKLNFVNAKVLGIVVTGSDIEKKTYRYRAGNYRGDYDSSYGGVSE